MLSWDHPDGMMLDDSIRGAATGRSPWLQDELEQQDQAAHDETGEDRTHERPSAHAGIPGRQSGPEAEREGF